MARATVRTLDLFGARPFTSSPPMCGNGPSALIYPHASNPEAVAYARELFWTSGRQLEVTQPLSLPQHRCDLSVAGVQVREVTYFAQRNPTKSRDPFGGWLSRYSTHRFKGAPPKLPPRMTRLVFTVRNVVPSKN